MKVDETQPKKRTLEPLDSLNQPPPDRFCDVVLDGGVINGVVYPGFLVELARQFRFRSLGGTSVGAIAASLAAACEYNRRFGSDNGFNEGLAKMPDELADWIDEPNQITRIRSLFQPHRDVQPLFDCFVDLLGKRTERVNKVAKEEREAQPDSVLYEAPEPSKSSMRLIYDIWSKIVTHLGAGWRGLLWWSLAALDASLIIVLDSFWFATVASPANWFVMAFLWAVFFLSGTLILHPLWKLIQQATTLMKLPGSGACTGMRASKSNTQGLSEWLYEGVQKSANLPSHRPLTFGDLWKAPGGPSGASGEKDHRSIDLRMITTCLSHGRIYELPLAADDPVLMFKLSELKRFFPDPVIAHLRQVSKPLRFETCAVLQRKFYERSIVISEMDAEGELILDRLNKLSERIDTIFKTPEDAVNGLDDPDIRELPTADLPIVVAARLSMSCPILFQNIPLIGFNLDSNAEDIDFVRLWFSDGGIGSNFPIHLFDKPIPRWPTFGLKILDEPPRKISKGKPLTSYIPYHHLDGSDDNLLFPRDRGAFTNLSGMPNVASFVKYLFSIYTSAKDGHDQSYLRMPEVRNRVVRVYLNNRAGNMLNLMIEPEKITSLAFDVGVRGGRNATSAYLAELENPKLAKWVNTWQDHRWVRFNMLTHGLRSYLKGFSQAVQQQGLPETRNRNSLIDQISQATKEAPLRSRATPGDEVELTQDQSDQLLEIVKAISNLEHQLRDLDMPQPYKPEPMPALRFKPRY